MEFKSSNVVKQRLTYLAFKTSVTLEKLVLFVESIKGGKLKESESIDYDITALPG